MKFYLDTENYENIKISISDLEKENIDVLIQEYCFAMASFFVDFANKLNCNASKAKSLQEVCFSCVERDVDVILEDNVLDSND